MPRFVCPECHSGIYVRLRAVRTRGSSGRATGSADDAGPIVSCPTCSVEIRIKIAVFPCSTSSSTTSAAATVPGSTTSAAPRNLATHRSIADTEADSDTVETLVN